MYRRRFIAVAGGALVGMAGCADDATPSPADGTTSTDRPPAPATSGGHVDVAYEAAQPTIVKLQTDMLSLAPSGHQYLYVQVETSEGPGPSPETFRFLFDGDEYTPFDHHTIYRNRVDTPYRRSMAEGWVLYRLPPTGSADGARLVQGEKEWTPSARIRELLATPPASFSVTPSFPEAVPHDEQPTVSLAVENEDDRPGRFVACLSRSGPSVAMIPATRVSEPVPAGGAIDVAVTDQAHRETVFGPERNDGEPDMRYFLELPSRRVDGSVRVID